VRCGAVLPVAVLPVARPTQEHLAQRMKRSKGNNNKHCHFGKSLYCRRYDGIKTRSIARST
jgi:hypothetical protein